MTSKPYHWKSQLESDRAARDGLEVALKLKQDEIDGLHEELRQKVEAVSEHAGTEPFCAPFGVGTEVRHRGSGELVTICESPTNGEEGSAWLASWIWVRRGGGEVVAARVCELEPRLHGSSAAEHRRAHNGTTHCPHCGADYPHLHDKKGYPHQVPTMGDGAAATAEARSMREQVAELRRERDHWRECWQLSEGVGCEQLRDTLEAAVKAHGLSCGVREDVHARVCRQRDAAVEAQQRAEVELAGIRSERERPEWPKGYEDHHNEHHRNETRLEAELSAAEQTMGNALGCKSLTGMRRVIENYGDQHQLPVSELDKLRAENERLERSCRDAELVRDQRWAMAKQAKTEAWALQKERDELRAKLGLAELVINAVGASRRGYLPETVIDAFDAYDAAEPSKDSGTQSGKTK